MSENSARFVYLWEYLVSDDHMIQFQQAYGLNGLWVQLFSQSDGYIRTELLHDVDNPNRFITIDYWVSKEARDKFRIQFAEAFGALDEVCEAFTIEERFLGDLQLERK
jgi:heme-degrading monooxygenase HmoA